MFQAFTVITYTNGRHDRTDVAVERACGHEGCERCITGKREYKDFECCCDDGNLCNAAASTLLKASTLAAAVALACITFALLLC